MAQSLTPPSVSDLCARELPFGLRFEPGTGLCTVVGSFFLGFGRLGLGRGGSEDSSFGEDISSTSARLRGTWEGLERTFFFATGRISVALSSTAFVEPCV